MGTKAHYFLQFTTISENEILWKLANFHVSNATHWHSQLDSLKILVKNYPKYEEAQLEKGFEILENITQILENELIHKDVL